MIVADGKDATYALLTIRTIKAHASATGILSPFTFDITHPYNCGVVDICVQIGFRRAPTACPNGAKRDQWHG
jgi:hypothetical protein